MDYNDANDYDKLAALENLKNKMQENFIELGQLLSDVKRTRLFKIKGYVNFKEFVENEYGLPASVANRLIKIHDTFLIKHDLDEQTVKKIGFDKLNIVTPMLKDSDRIEIQDWIEKASDLSPSELKEEIKEIKEKQKEKNMKDVLTEQVFENLVNFFNCSKKELNYKLAVYFQDRELEGVRNEIISKLRQIEMESEQN